VIQKRAILHEKAVQKVAKENITYKKQRAGDSRPRSSRVSRRSVHPAYLMARALGVDPRRVEVTAEPPLWGCIIHNQPVSQRN
jgi:hypothetical protein